MTINLQKIYYYSILQVHKKKDTVLPENGHCNLPKLSLQFRVTLNLSKLEMTYKTINYCEHESSCRFHVIL
jgi:hypothetical protein